MDPTMLYTAVATLSGAVAVLWKAQHRMSRRMETKLDECETDRQMLWFALADVKGVSPDDLRRQIRETK